MNSNERSVIAAVVLDLRKMARSNADRQNEHPSSHGRCKKEDQSAWRMADDLQHLINQDKNAEQAKVKPMTLRDITAIPNYTAPGNLDGSHPADDWQESRKVHDDDTRNSITQEDKLIMEAIYSLQCEGYDDQAAAVRRLFDKHLGLCDAIYNLSPMETTA